MWPAQVPLWSDGSDRISTPVELICGGWCGGRALLVNGDGVGAVGGQEDGGSNQAIAWTSPPKENCSCNFSFPTGNTHVGAGTERNQKVLELVRDSHVLARAQKAFNDAKRLMDALTVEGERVDQRLEVADSLVRGIEGFEIREADRAQDQEDRRSASPELKKRKKF